jgi:hypothetical protein
LIAFVKNVIAHARLVKELVILIVHHVHMSISFIMALVNPVIQKNFCKTCDNSLEKKCTECYDGRYLETGICKECNVKS